MHVDVACYFTKESPLGHSMREGFAAFLYTQILRKLMYMKTGRGQQRKRWQMVKNSVLYYIIPQLRQKATKLVLVK